MKAPAALFVLLGVSAVPAFAQSSVPGQKGQAAVHTVINFADLVRQEEEHPSPPPKRREIPDNDHAPPDNRIPQILSVPPGEKSSLKAITVAPAAVSPSTSASFIGGTDDDTSIPPDTNGALGPNHAVVMINNGITMFDRTGTCLSGCSPRITLDTFWASTGASGVFDPHVVYDPYNNHWITSATSNAQTASSSLLVGVSTTSDPTGTWHLFKITADSGGTNWADYPAMGFNKNWVGLSVNLFANTNNVFAKASIFAINKANLYAASPSLTFTRFDDTASFTQLPATTFDNSLSTLYLVENFNPSSGGFGFIRVSTITGSVGSEVYTLGPATCCGTLPGLVRTANTWASSPRNGADFAPQAGTTTKIQNGDHRFLSFLYRNGSLWAAQTAFLPAGTTPTRAAAQWWQFDTSGNVQQFGRVDDSTGTNFYAYPTIAVNKNNDALIGYSQFSATTFAAAGYSYRTSGDTSSTMETGVVLKAGEALYSKSSLCWGNVTTRWGDYSATVVDPVNDLDLWTIQEYATSSTVSCSSQTDHLWGTWWGRISPAPAVSLSSSSVNLGNQAVGVTGSAVPVTLTNTGTTTLTLTTLSAGGEFSETDTCGATTLLVGSSCTINVKFTPTQSGTRTGSITVNDNASSTPQTISLSGTGFYPQLNLSALDVTFGSQATGTTSSAQVLTLSNGGTISFNLSQAMSGDFGKTTTCGSTLAGGATCTISVTFSPTVAGTRTGTLSINDGGVNAPVVVRLFGTGTSASPVGAKVRFSNVAWNFGDQAVGTTSAGQAIVLNNNGDAALSVTSVTAHGDFSQTNGCGSSVSAGSSCTITVVFAPTATGIRRGDVTIVDTASASPHVLRLSGNGSTTAPKVSFSAASLNFGNQARNTASSSQIVTVTNSGSASLTISAVAAKGDFGVTGSCVATLAPGDACTLTITFTPSATGTRLGSINMTSTATGSPHVIRLFGTGT